MAKRPTPPTPQHEPEVQRAIVVRGPNIRDQDLLDEFCARMTEGQKISDICKDPIFPSQATVYRTMAVDENVARAITRARIIAQHAFIDQTLDMADGATPETVSVVTLQIRTRQWNASKIAPRIYGDNKNIDIHEDVTVTTTDTLDVSDLDDEELDVLERVLIKTKAVEDAKKGRP